MPGYRKMFFDDPKDFFERYSINLPGNPEEAGKIGQLELMRSTFNPVVRPKGVEGGDFAGTSAGKSFFKFRTIAHSVHVSALGHNAAWKVDEGAKRATLVVRKAAASVTRTEEESAGMEWFLCLMLPWIQNGVTSTHLRKSTRANAFFTGQMNGCSFVVAGDPEEPFVSHINCNDPNDYEDKYRQVLGDAGADRSNALRLGREDYKLDNQGKEGHERLIREQLATQNRKLAGDIITDTLCFVMGRRVAGRWEFFYQRVITQQYSYKRRLGRTGGLVKRLGRDDREVQNVTIYRSISSYNKLWPDGRGRLDM